MKFECNAKELWEAIEQIRKLVKHNVSDKGIIFIADKSNLFVQDSSYDVAARVKVGANISEDGIAVIGEHAPLAFLDGELTCEVGGEDLVFNNTRLRTAQNDFDTIEHHNTPFVIDGTLIELPLLTPQTTWSCNDTLPYQECLFLTPHAVGSTTQFCASWIEAEIGLDEAVAIKAHQLPRLDENTKVFVSPRYLWVIGETLSYRACTVVLGDYLTDQVKRINEYDVVFEMPVTDEFIQALKRCQVISRSVFTDGLSGLDVRDGELFIESPVTEVGYDCTTIPLDWEGDELSFSFRPFQLIKMCGNTPDPVLKIKHGAGRTKENKVVEATIFIVTNNENEITHVSMGCNNEWRKKGAKK